MVFYRKYRPQTIEELDSEEVRKKLKSLLQASAPTFIQIPHAFLFTGPKGLGKTSTARIIAKIINCTGRKDTSGKDIEPCNSCDQCQSIINGTNMDVLEIDAASNRGIDEIRDLKEKVRLTPFSAKKKVYIIDEVHMLTTEAFNALLKTLEEPPSHTVFILCTTELHKIPSTILSRCFHLEFKIATEDELVRSFRRIVHGEELDIDEEVLYKIAKLAEGGFRDGTKILEELVSLSGGSKITADILERKYHLESIEKFTQDLLKAIENRDITRSLELTLKIVDVGIDIKYFISQFIEELHSQLLLKVGVIKKDRNASHLSLEELRQLIHLFSQAIVDTKYAVIPQLPLELAIINWCTNKDQNENKHIATEKEQSSTEQKVTLQKLRKDLGEIAKERAVNGEQKKEKKEKVSPTPVSILSYTAVGNPSDEWLVAFWRSFIASVKVHNHTIAGVLNSCSLKYYDKKQMVIEAAYQFHKEKLEEAKTYSLLQKISEELTGNPIKVTIELKK
ncbi:MAG: DNA polymerase III, subunit gamma and tau [Patescibacteria group bacterium]|nr:MAG: DNA polymerase III, subunit gamma and tau [Patescibacteria group bacterium]